jgi:hypothetical protein
MYVCENVWMCVRACLCICVYACMYVCVCMCARVCLCIYVYMYACVYVCMYVYMCVCALMHACVCACMYVHMYICTYIHTRMHVYVCTYVYMYACVREIQFYFQLKLTKANIVTAKYFLSFLRNLKHHEAALPIARRTQVTDKQLRSSTTFCFQNKNISV